MGFWQVILVGCVVLAVAAFGVWGVRTWHRKREKAWLTTASTMFRQRREWLEADFLSAATATGKPRGLSWADCDFSDEISFGRDRRTGQLSAFVSLTIKFEAVAGGDMEEVEAVALHKLATAVFHYDGEKWFSNGRAVFNLKPHETIERFGHHQVLRARSYT